MNKQEQLKKTESIYNSLISKVGELVQQADQELKSLKAGN